MSPLGGRERSRPSFKFANDCSVAINDLAMSNVQELARAIGKDMAYVSRITRFTLLTPEIIHGVLTGQLDQIGVEKCKHPFPILWDEQKKFFDIE